MRTAIVTDSNSGIFENEAKKLGIYVVPMPIVIDGKTYYEGIDLTYEKFYQSLMEGRKVTSSQPSPGNILDLWEYLFTQRYDEIVYIPMSSGLSHSCETAILLAENYDGRVQVVDNHRISVTQRHAVEDALMMAQQGYSAKEIKEILEKTAYDSIIYVGVETLEYLKKGGRITPAGVAMGSILHIKPLLVIDGERLDAFAKIRGTKNCKKSEIEQMKKVAEEYHRSGAEIRIGVASSILDDEKSAEWLQMIQSAFPDEDIHYDPLTFSIGCHVGPGAFGVGITKKLVL
ncbi:MAG: DegV family protein [Faecalibacillus sp.]